MVESKDPKSRPQSRWTREQVLECYERNDRNKEAVSRELGLARSTVGYHVARAGIDEGKPIFAGRIEPMETETCALPKAGQVKTYILTCAQNNTPVNTPVWRNLLALAEHYRAEIKVSQFTYNKGAYHRGDVKPGKEPIADDYADLWYAKEILPYVCNARVQLAPDLVFCGESNISPSAEDPLSGYQTYTGPDSCIIPHSKISLRSLPRLKGRPSKQLYTTGTVTMRNYIAKKAGQKAEFHHAFGALIVQVDSDGDWFARHLNASSDGTIYDMQTRVRAGIVTQGHWVKGIIWGDVHVWQLDPIMQDVCWGTRDSIIDFLRPEAQVFHDLHDHYNRNHHHEGDPHLAFEKWLNGDDSVQKELEADALFLKDSKRCYCESVVVSSNHDGAFKKWLKNPRGQHDAPNVLLWHEGNAAFYRAKKAREPFYAPEWAIRQAGDCPADVRFLKEDESFSIAGIECGQHGNNGPNGMRGSAHNLETLGEKAIIGHAHTPCILNGLYVVGVMGSLDMGYNSGPSSWSHTFAVIYPNGKRALVTFRNFKWRATECKQPTRRSHQRPSPKQDRRSWAKTQRTASA